MRFRALLILLFLASQAAATVSVTTSYTKAISLSMVIRKLSAGVEGDYWDDVAQAFTATPTGDAEKISLTEDSGKYTGVTSAALGTYTGDITVSIWDPSNTKYVGVARVYVAAGVEIIEGRTVSTKVIAPARTWRVGREGSTASNIITLTANDTVTLAMDFSTELNPGTTISAAVSAVDIGGGGLVPTNVTVDQTKTRIHLDVTGLSAATTYSIRVTGTTTDSQTISGEGKIRVR